MITKGVNFNLFGEEAKVIVANETKNYSRVILLSKKIYFGDDYEYEQVLDLVARDLPSICKDLEQHGIDFNFANCRPAFINERGIEEMLENEILLNPNTDAFYTRDCGRVQRNCDITADGDWCYPTFVCQNEIIEKCMRTEDSETKIEVEENKTEEEKKEVVNMNNTNTNTESANKKGFVAGQIIWDDNGENCVYLAECNGMAIVSNLRKAFGDLNYMLYLHQYDNDYENEEYEKIYVKSFDNLFTTREEAMSAR